MKATDMDVRITIRKVHERHAEASMEPISLFLIGCWKQVFEAYEDKIGIDDAIVVANHVVKGMAKQEGLEVDFTVKYEG